MDHTCTAMNAKCSACLMKFTACLPRGARRLIESASQSVAPRSAEVASERASKFKLECTRSATRCRRWIDPLLCSDVLCSDVLHKLCSWGEASRLDFSFDCRSLLEQKSKAFHSTQGSEWASKSTSAD